MSWHNIAIACFSLQNTFDVKYNAYITKICRNDLVSRQTHPSPSSPSREEKHQKLVRNCQILAFFINSNQMLHKSCELLPQHKGSLIGSISLIFLKLIGSMGRTEGSGKLVILSVKQNHWNWYYRMLMLFIKPILAFSTIVPQIVMLNEKMKYKFSITEIPFFI